MKESKESKWRLFSRKPSVKTPDESAMMTLSELDEVERTTTAVEEDTQTVKTASLVLAQSSLATLLTAEQSASNCLSSLHIQSGIIQSRLTPRNNHINIIKPRKVQSRRAIRKTTVNPPA
jgi:nicotinate-nucleotide pyrophosphorylase